MLRPLILIGLLAAASATAQTVPFGGMKADTGAPVEMTADSLSVDQASGRATFRGNVVIGQGQMRLKADTVAVTYAEGGPQRIRSLHATGGVTLVNGPDAAEAKEAVYDVASGNIVLTGDVVLTQGQSILAGDRVEVNLSTGTAQAEGRVRSVLQPGAD